MTHSFAPRIQHVQPGVTAYTPSSREALEHLEGAVRQLSSTPHIYKTKQTSGLLQDIADDLAHLKLEDTLYTGATPKWHDRFANRELVTQKQALLQTKQKLVDPGGQLMARYHANMSFGKMKCNTDDCAREELRKYEEADQGIGWTDTAIRTAHAWAVHELKGLRDELHPLADAARKRTEQYLDEMDITDRYSGYRRNLGSLKRTGPEDAKALDNVLSSTMGPSMAPRWNLNMNWERAKAVGTHNYLAPGDANDCELDKEALAKKHEVKLDPRTAAGIEILYPGKSEYEDEFKIPSLVEMNATKSFPPTTHRATFEQPPGVRGRGSTIAFDSAQVTNKGYQVNPTPNYLRDWVSAKKSPDLLTSLPISETKDTYRWPDINLVRTSPFIT